MKEKTIVKEFAVYGACGVLGMAAVSCYILADTFFVSLGLGKSGLAALNLAIPVYNFVHGTGLMLGMGGATKFSVYKSRGEHDKANRVFTNTLYLAAAFSALFMLTGAFLSGPLARALGADDEVFAMTDIYGKVLLLFSPAFVFNDVLLCFTRNDGRPRLATCATVVGSLSNIVMDWVFIFPCGLGMFGAVLATGFSPVIGVGICSLHFLQRKNGFRAVAARPQFRYMRSAFTLGFPSLVEQLSAAVVIIVFNYIILGLLGNTGVAAYGVVANISLVVAAVFSGLAQGAQPLMSREYGKNDFRRLNEVFRCALLSALAMAALVYACVFFFAEPIAALFNSEGNERLGAVAAEGLRLYFIAAPFTGCNVLFCSRFTSAERPVSAYVVSLLRGFAVIIPAAFLFSSAFGMTGVWLSFPASEALVCALGAALLFRLRRKGGVGDAPKG